MKSISAIAFIWCLACACLSAEYPLTVSASGDLICEWSHNDQRYQVLIDTGSSDSILSSAIATAWNLTVVKQSGTISSFHGDSQGYGAYQGITPCTGVAANWNKWLVLDLAKISKENGIIAIIGIDYLRAKKAVIDFNAMQIRIP